VATCRLIVNSALRKLGRLGAGREPRVADQTDVLAALQGLYGSWVASGAFGRLGDVVPTGTNYMASGGERILRESAATLVVTLPELVADSYGTDYGRGPGRYFGTVVTVETVGNDTIVTVEPSQPIGYALPPRDGAVVVISDRFGGNTRTWLYDGHIKLWQELEDLQLDDEAPRSASDPEGLGATLALEIADTFGAEVGPTTQRQAMRFQVAMTHRYGMRREPVPGVYF
jgi:hypothetical protein